MDTKGHDDDDVFVCVCVRAQLLDMSGGPGGFEHEAFVASGRESTAAYH